MKYSTFATILLALGSVLGVYANDLPDVSTDGSWVLQPGEILVITGFGIDNNFVITNTLNIPITTMVPSSSTSVPLAFLPFSGLATSPGSLTAVAAPSATSLLLTPQKSDSSTETRSGQNDQLSSTISTFSNLATQTSVSSITSTQQSSASAAAVTIIILPTINPFVPPPNGSVFLPNLTVSTEGLCGHEAGQTCMMSPFGSCCGSNNTCGNSDNECGSGCQINYGGCNLTVSSVLSTSSTKGVSISTSSPSSPTFSTFAATATLGPSSTSETPSGSSSSTSSLSSTFSPLSAAGTSLITSLSSTSSPTSTSSLVSSTSSPSSAAGSSSTTSLSSTSSPSSAAGSSSPTSSPLSTSSPSSTSSSSSSISSHSSTSSLSSTFSLSASTNSPSPVLNITTSSSVAEVSSTVIQITTISGPAATVAQSSLPSLTTSSLPPGLTESPNILRNLTWAKDRLCGDAGDNLSQYTCLGSPMGLCCGSGNTCGNTDVECGIGNCQPLYGLCSVEGYVVVNNTIGTLDLFVSWNGFCGSDVNMTCYRSTFGDCCGPSNSCGNASEFCSSGCQVEFGQCHTPPVDGMHKRNVRVLRRGRYMHKHRDWWGGMW
jgi:hypothetical protein